MAKGILVQDDTPSIYVYYQYFTLPNGHKTYCRKGFIALVTAYDYQEKVILRHENTLPKSVEERLKLLEATGLQVSPTHGLYTDPAFLLEPIMDRAMENPVYAVEDYQGVTDAMAIVTDPFLVQQFVDVLAEKTVILADGHHRYDCSVCYRKAQMQQFPGAPADALFHSHFMYFTNTEAHDLMILPTHRLIHALNGLTEEELLQKTAGYFTIKPIDNPESIDEIIAGKQWTFGLLIGENAYKIRLRPEVLSQCTWNFPDAVKQLDLTVLHYFLIDKVLGIRGKDQRDTALVSYERNYQSCFKAVYSQQAAMAVIVNAVTIEEVKEVCQSGYTLPQKSTYFYPKVICGLVFASIFTG
jgi:uncharacterized protein (DUF1015 family)